MNKLLISSFEYVIGLSLDNAQQKTDQQYPGVVVRQIECDGMTCFPEDDFRLNRINVCTQSKKIISIDGAY